MRKIYPRQMLLLLSAAILFSFYSEYDIQCKEIPLQILEFFILDPKIVAVDKPSVIFAWPHHLPPVTKNENIFPHFSAEEIKLQQLCSGFGGTCLQRELPVQLNWEIIFLSLSLQCRVRGVGAAGGGGGAEARWA